MQVRTVNYKAADAAATLTNSLLNTGFSLCWKTILSRQTGWPASMMHGAIFCL